MKPKFLLKCWVAIEREMKKLMMITWNKRFLKKNHIIIMMIVRGRVMVSVLHIIVPNSRNCHAITVTVTPYLIKK